MQNYVQFHSTVLGFGRIMCRLCENQLKSIDILESKLENLKEKVGMKISNTLKEEDEISKPESPKESSPKRVCQRNIFSSPVCFTNSEYALLQL